MEGADLEPLRTVRTRFPATPDADADALRTHAEHLAELRERLDHERLRGVEPAMIFDPRTPQT